MVLCAVYGCNTTSNKKYAQRISFYTFPKEETIRRKWVEFCDRDKNFHFHNARICNLHFSLEDYQMKYRIMGDTGGNNRKIKPGSIPSVKGLPTPFVTQTRRTLSIKKAVTPLPGLNKTKTPQETIKNITWHKPTKNVSTLNNKVTIDVIMPASITNTSSSNSDSSTTSNGVFPSKNIGKIQVKRLDLLKDADNSYECEISRPSEDQKYVIQLQNRLNEIEANSQKDAQIEELKKRVHALEAENLKLKQQNKFRETTLKSIFSESQIRKLKTNGGRVRWSLEDFSKAAELRRHVGNKGYNYIKNTLNYPIPSRSALKRWATLARRAGNVVSISYESGDSDSDEESGKT